MGQRPEISTDLKRSFIMKKSVKTTVLLSLLVLMLLGMTSCFAKSNSGQNLQPTSMDAFVLNGTKLKGLTAYGESLTSIIIPNKITAIGEYAFEDCESLTSITIPDSVTYIGEGAFWGCKGLTSITIPGTLTSIGDHAFVNCTGLTSITIPSSVTSIGEYAFLGCHGLTNITIPDSVTYIGEGAISGCFSLTSVTIPDSVTSLDGGFAGCKSLTNITVSKGNPEFSSVDGVLFSKDKKTLVLYPKGKNGDYTIPKGVVSIGEWAFCDCIGLTSVTIPNGVTSIGGGAFSGCTGLTSITIPSTVVSLGKNPIYECPNLSDIYVNMEEIPLLFNDIDIPDGCKIHWNSTGPESV